MSTVMSQDWTYKRLLVLEHLHCNGSRSHLLPPYYLPIISCTSSKDLESRDFLLKPPYRSPICPSPSTRSALPSLRPPRKHSFGSQGRLYWLNSSGLGQGMGPRISVFSFTFHSDQLCVHVMFMCVCAWGGWGI